MLRARAIVEACEAAGMQAEVVSHIDQLVALDSAPEDDGRRLVLAVDAPRGLDLDRVGNLVHRLLGPTIPIVYLHYPRRRTQFSDAEAGRAFKPINAMQLWRVMADVFAPATGMPAVGEAVVAADDDINAKLIDALLRRIGCEVTLVRDGRAALQAAREADFDMAFIDLRMPHMDGIDFTRAYRAQEPPGRHLPIVALTANAAEEVRADCLRAGMDEFVTKPVDPAKLQELILRYGVACQPEGAAR